MSTHCWFHRWRTRGLSGPLSMVEECEKCGRQRVFDGVMGEWTSYPAGTWMEATTDGE